MNGLNRAQFRKAHRFFSRLEIPYQVIWTDGPNVQRLCRRLKRRGLWQGAAGKGLNFWLASGFVIARRNASVVVTHDCDILNYDRSFLASLCYPLVDPALGYQYCKAYYARVTDRMYGRVTRLFVTPLVRALGEQLGSHPLLEYLDDFRYPLSGEFAMSLGVARAIEVPGDWGMEVGILADVFRHAAPGRICQVELAETYEHKHRTLGNNGGSSGLVKMASDIAGFLFRRLNSGDIILKAGFLAALRSSYLCKAQETLKRYADDARINGLAFDVASERAAIQRFVQAIDRAARAARSKSADRTLLPSWSQVESILPGMTGALLEAVEKDNRAN
jgi:glucosyl-3-phosphoglycerate synthase